MKNWKKWFFITFLILIIIVAFTFWKKSRSTEIDEIPTAKVQHGNFRISLQATGIMRALKSRSVPAKGWWGMTVAKIVDEGSYVKEGDFLAQLTHSDMDSWLEESQTELEAAQKRYEQAQATYQLEELELMLSLKKAERDLQSAELEAKEKKFSNISAAEEEKVEKSLEVARAEYEFAKESYDIKVVQSKAKLEEAKYELERAKKEVDGDRKRVEEMTVISPGDGIVVYAEDPRNGGKIGVGSGAWRGMKLIELPDLSKMIVEAEVNEIDIGGVKKEQKVIVKLDAFPELEFFGIINQISTLARESKSRSGVQVFGVTIYLDEVDEKMKPGMTASVEIILDEIPGSLFVPQEAVFEKEDKTVTYVKKDGSYEMRIVILGKSNENHIIVKDGLEASETLFLRDPTIKLEEVGGGNEQKKEEKN